jgi:hypothetical protein
MNFINKELDTTAFLLEEKSSNMIFLLDFKQGGFGLNQMKIVMRQLGWNTNKWNYSQIDWVIYTTTVLLKQWFFYRFYIKADRLII